MLNHDIRAAAPLLFSGDIKALPDLDSIIPTATNESFSISAEGDRSNIVEWLGSACSSTPVLKSQILMISLMLLASIRPFANSNVSTRMSR